MTFYNKKYAVGIIKSGGWFEDLEVDTLWEFTSAHDGKQLYACFDHPNHDMFCNEYVLNPVLLWSKYEGKIQDPS